MHFFFFIETGIPKQKPHPGNLSSWFSDKRRQWSAFESLQGKSIDFNHTMCIKLLTAFTCIQWYGKPNQWLKITNFVFFSIRPTLSKAYKWWAIGQLTGNTLIPHVKGFIIKDPVNLLVLFQINADTLKFLRPVKYFFNTKSQFTSNLHAGLLNFSEKMISAI